MKIANVEAVWLHCPIPEDKQHVSDFGRIASFDSTLVIVTTDQGLRGYGEAKAAVGSSGSCASLAAIIRQELAPMLVGQDARHINAIWGRLYNGPRQEHAERRGRAFPVLGRRGLLMSAMSGVDLALWDLLGKSLGRPVLDLLGGPARPRMPAYASGGWADAARIGEQLGSYVQRGFRAVKMRVGVMDGSVAASVARVRAARAALGPDVEIMVDAHGTYSTPEAKTFCAEVADLHLRWFEEPVSADNRVGAEEVKRASTIPIAVGESEFTVMDFQDLVRRNTADVLQPDMAICGGLSEGLRISALAVANQLELAPHCWGSAFSFSAGVTLGFASPAACLIEYSLGANPLLHDLCEEDDFFPQEGVLVPPRRPGWGLTPRAAFIDRYARTI